MAERFQMNDRVCRHPCQAGAFRKGEGGGQSDMEKMLNYIDTLNELDTEGSAYVPCVPVQNVFR